MSNQAPTVGRRVYFWPSQAMRHPYAVLDKNQALDAGVVFVHNERLVNLLVSDHLGQSHSVQNVPFLQQEEPKPEGLPFATWMPYQVKAHAAEEANKKSLEQQEIERKLAAERAEAQAKLAQHQAKPPEAKPADPTKK